MKLIPSSGSRFKTLIASALSRGGPHTPRPVICMAPKPSRLTVISPPIWKVDMATPSGIQTARFLDHLAGGPGARGVAADLGAGFMTETPVPDGGGERDRRHRPERGGEIGKLRHMMTAQHHGALQ